MIPNSLKINLTTGDSAARPSEKVGPGSVAHSDTVGISNIQDPAGQRVGFPIDTTS